MRKRTIRLIKASLISGSQTLLFVAGLVLVWQILYSLHLWSSWLFPSPLQVISTLAEGFRKGVYLWGIVISLRRLFIGFAFSMVIGTLLGFVIAKNKLVKRTLGAFVVGLQALPSTCWLPIALLWFGLNEKAIIFVVIMGSILSVTISVEGAVRNIPLSFLRAGRVLGANELQMYRYVIFPYILPEYVTGMKQSWSFAWRSLIAGEMLFITVGLGQLLMFGRELNDMPQIIAVMLVIMFLGMLFDRFVFGIMESAVREKWGLVK